MTAQSFTPKYEGGVPVFRPKYADFLDFRQFVNGIESFGMKTGVVKVIPPQEWIESLPKTPTAVVDQVEIRNPIEQLITMNGGRGVFKVDNFEKRKKYNVKQWIKQCNLLSNQPPTKRGEPQRVLGNFTADKGGYVNYDDTEFTRETTDDLEAKFWKCISYGGSPMYGADLPGSLFSENNKHWNVANLDSLLSVLPEKISGVNDAYLYCGMWKSVFSWHLEDVDLPSINYIHFGAPKQWYSIPQEYHEKFYNLMTSLWPEEQAKCSEFLRHKTFLADPAFIKKHGIPVNRIVHRQQEFMITFPYGYHAGFNYGFNIAESVNFAHDSWLEIGAKAAKCQCVPYSVGIDVQQLIDAITSKPALSLDSDKSFTRKRDLLSTDLGLKARKYAKHRLGECVLCPHIFNNRYIGNKANTAKVHVTCANLVTETWILNNQVFGLDTIPKDRFKLKCGLCKLSLGCCFQCSVPKCTKAYHGSCAAAVGADYHDPNRPLCPIHRQPQNKYSPASYLLIGDIVQFKRDKQFGAGIITDVGIDSLHIDILPNPDTSGLLYLNNVIDVYGEPLLGPYKEQLAPISKKRRISNSAKVSSAVQEATPSLNSHALEPLKILKDEAFDDTVKSPLISADNLASQSNM